MKNPHTESCYRRMKQYHRQNSWQLQHGIYMPHIYPDDSPPVSWDDVGFILNGRRIMVWWQHPRLIYSDAITDLAYQQAGDPPAEEANDFIESFQKVYKQVGRSRKKVKSYRAPQFLKTSSEYDDKVAALESKMKQEGIDITVHASCSVKVLSWCRGVDICAPLEIRSKNDVFELVTLVKRLLTGQTTLQLEFPDYVYSKEDWVTDSQEVEHTHLCAKR